ncbi:MAG: dienelactone hydrolase family protein [Halieaceae bacterium]|nr:dienelactone hydrolase family protein [Halieaceae bacterium]
MCHGTPSPSFPKPDVKGEISAEIDALVFGEDNAGKKIAIIPDIYGLNQFYRGFSTYIAERGARVYLVNPFAGLGELPEVTREAAFARRHKVKDKEFVDRFETFCSSQSVDGVIGFCLGGYYVFELARRNVSQDLVGFYGFPQGMQNDDPLATPFDYLESIGKPHTSLMPGQDASVGPDNVAKLAEMAKVNKGIDLHFYEESGHGFLTDLDSEDATLKANATDALAQCERVLGL